VRRHLLNRAQLRFAMQYQNLSCQLFVKGDGQNAELARLKGEFEAIEQASIQKN
jgi:hypothetical protein